MIHLPFLSIVALQASFAFIFKFQPLSGIIAAAKNHLKHRLRGEPRTALLVNAGA